MKEAKHNPHVLMRAVEYHAFMSHGNYKVNAYLITIWCSSDLGEPELSEALEQGELWEVAEDVQYQIALAGG
jgi:hypothetical protein